jgi:hypothetical protein
MNRTPCIDNTFLPRGSSRGWGPATTGEVVLMRGAWRGKGVLERITAHPVLALGGSCGKGAPGQSTALHLRGRRVAPTALALQAAPARASRPLARRSRSTGSPASGLACSVLQPAAELASLTAFAALRQWRRVSSRSALTRAAASAGLAGRAGRGRPAVRKAQAVPRTACVPAHLLGAAQARRGLPGHAFAVAFVLLHPREEPSRRAVPAGGDLWSDEDRRTGVGARSALRELTRRNCLSATNEVSEASSATRPLAENRSAVGAVRRPRNHEPPAGTAWRGAKALNTPTGTAQPEAKALKPLADTNQCHANALKPRANAASRHAQAPVTCACSRKANPRNPKTLEQKLRAPHASPASGRSA